MEFENQCGTCNNFHDKDNTNKSFDVRWARSERGYCDWYRCFYWADDSCGHYRRRGSYVSTCFITTIVCHILNYSDDCEVLNQLRNFRNEVMQKNPKYHSMLFEYDTIGPKIAENLQKDYEEQRRLEIPRLLYNFYILPTAQLVRDKKYDFAVLRYDG